MGQSGEALGELSESLHQYAAIWSVRTEPTLRFVGQKVVCRSNN